MNSRKLISIFTLLLVFPFCLVGCGPGAGDPDAPIENPPTEADIDSTMDTGT